MAKEKRNLRGCLVLTEHHASPHKARLMVLACTVSPELDIEKELTYRFQLVSENIKAALVQLEKVRVAAEKVGCKEVLNLLKEETVPCGHDIPDSARKSS